jgi:signal peptidase
MLGPPRWGRPRCIRMDILSPHPPAHPHARRVLALLAEARSRLELAALVDPVLRTIAVLISVALIAALTLFAAVGVGRAFGYHALTVMSGSMEPHLRIGDVVVGRRTSVVWVRPGDVISFRDPVSGERILTHRVVRKRIDGANFRLVTRGDANTGVERWQIPVDGDIGSVSFRIPKLGYALVWLRGPFGRIGFVVLPALLLAAIVLARIWRPIPLAR